MSLARTAKQKWNSTDPLLRAFFISLLAHLVIFGSWKLGGSLGITERLALFDFVKKAEEKLIPIPAAALMQPPAEREIELTFVEVDLSKADPEPENAKFYGAINTVAANPTIDKESDVPKIDGQIEQISKLTPDAVSTPQPLQPTPPPAAPDEFDREEKQDTKPAEVQPPGDLNIAKTAPEPRKADSNAETEKEETRVEQEQQRRRRPRTIAEARAASSRGAQRKQEGGVKRHDLSGSFDVKGSIVGSYDQRFIEAVRQCWHDMLDNISATEPGFVRLEFRINFRGQISEMRVAETTVNELQTLVCQQAIQKPAPYGEWPREMRLELKSDYRDVTFTFTYH